MSHEEYIEVTCLEDRIRRYVAASRCSKGYMIKTYAAESFVRPFVDNTAQILKEAKIGTVLLIALVLSLSAVIAIGGCVLKSGRSTGKPTKAEAARIVASKEGKCVACYIRASQGLMNHDYVVVGCDYNHTKSGNIRRGHMFGYALCVYHHRKHPLVFDSLKATAAIYGPSLMDGSALFHCVYGTDDELIALQNQLLEAA